MFIPLNAGSAGIAFPNFLKNDITGHKKTYKFGSGGDININEKDLFESLFGFYNGKKSHYIQDKESKKNTQLTKKQKEALHRFNLNDKATLENVKSKYKKLANYSKKIGIDFISTPFDDTAVDYLNPLVPFFKISSSDITNKPFIEYICSFGKPIILSTGASDLEEVQDAVNWIKPFNVPLALFFSFSTF